MLKPISNQQAYEMIKNGRTKQLFYKRHDLYLERDSSFSFVQFDIGKMMAKDIGWYEFFIYE